MAAETAANNDPLSLSDLPFRDLPALIAEHAQTQPHAVAVRIGEQQIDYAGFDALADRVAASLQRDGFGPGDAIAVCALSSIEYLALFVGALRAGLAVAPLAPGSTPLQLGGMAADAGARL
ncbi:MAG: AMP-binding protein, partial [Burkholderiales bacterium]|nr:AMP-binding protein [Burkholderiales bacterium]